GFAELFDDLLASEPDPDGMQGNGWRPMLRCYSLKTLAVLRRFYCSSQKKQQRRKRQQINPQPAPGEKCLPEFQTDDGQNLRQPLFDHLPPSSAPIRYS